MKAERVLCAWCGRRAYDAYRVPEGIVCGECAELYNFADAGTLAVDTLHHDGKAYRVDPPLVLTIKVDYYRTPQDKCLWGVLAAEVDHVWYSEDGEDAGEERRGYTGVTGNDKDALLDRLASTVMSHMSMLESRLTDIEGGYDPELERVTRAELAAMRTRFTLRDVVLAGR